eukprot:14290523-Heterocapsa_arctica.AAC.1
MLVAAPCARLCATIVRAATLSARQEVDLLEQLLQERRASRRLSASHACCLGCAPITRPKNSAIHRDGGAIDLQERAHAPHGRRLRRRRARNLRS